MWWIVRTTVLFLAAFLTIGLTVKAYANRLLVISDIDDTIKVSHILSNSGKVSRASDVTTPFRGMAELYRAIIQENQQNRRVVYLSNAPATIAGIPALMISHKTFLSFNEFPYGEVELRENIFDKNHKINTIRRLIYEEKPDTVILFGDNGERDPEVYHQAYLEFGNKVKMITFIHQMYLTKAPFYIPDYFAELGMKVFPEQNAFVTPVEISLELKNQQIITESSYNDFIENLIPQIVDESFLKWDGLKPLTFPRFKKCSEFVWKWKLTPELNMLYKKISSVCR